MQQWSLQVSYYNGDSKCLVHALFPMLLVVFWQAAARKVAGNKYFKATSIENFFKLLISDRKRVSAVWMAVSRKAKNGELKLASEAPAGEPTLAGADHTVG